jgi:hypothetical protein
MTVGFGGARTSNSKLLIALGAVLVLGMIALAVPALAHQG